MPSAKIWAQKDPADRRQLSHSQAHVRRPHLGRLVNVSLRHARPLARVGVRHFKLNSVIDQGSQRRAPNFYAVFLNEYAGGKYDRTQRWHRSDQGRLRPTL